MKATHLIAALVILPVISALAGRESGSRETARGGSIEAQGGSYGRFSAGSVSATSANGATYDAQGARAGRFSAGSSTATGPNGNTRDRSAARWNGNNVNAAGSTTTYNNNNNGNTATINRGAASTPYGATATRSTTVNGSNGNSAYRNTTVYENNTTYTGYRSGYVYTNGSYTAATINVNSVYIAPVGVYAGWKVMTQPQYVVVPAYATYPVEVAVQVQLQQQGYYAGAVDGQIGPATQKAIAKYQQANGLPPTGQINQALLKSLGII